EIACDARTAVRDTFGEQTRLRALDHGRLIEEDCTRPGASLQDGCDQRAVPTADVDDPRALPEAVCIDDSGGVQPGHGGLMLIEGCRGVGGVVKVGGERRAVYMVGGRPARPDTVRQPSQTPPPPRLAIQDGGRS